MTLKLLYTLSVCICLSSFAATGDSAKATAQKQSCPRAEKTKPASEKFSEYPLMRLLNIL